MDPSLLKEREKFLKRAAATPSVVIKAKAAPKAKRESSSASSDGTKVKRVRTSAAALKADTNMGAATSLSANFGMLAKIVDHMKKRHLEGNAWSLSLDEILEEIQVFDLPKATNKWLSQALPENRRITKDTNEDKFVYCPPHNIKGKKSLIKVLQHRDMQGDAGILMSELADCVPDPDKLVQSAGDCVTVLLTNVAKRKDKVLFYNDKESEVELSEELKSLWRSVPVDHLDEKKIEEYLHKHGIDSVKDLAPKTNNMGPKRRQRKGKASVMQNDHMQGVLQDYSIS